MYLLLALVCLAGAVLLVDAAFIRPGQAMPLEPGIFSEKINIPLQFQNLGVLQIPLEMENFILFQNFESLPPIIQTGTTLAFGIIFWALISLAMVYVSTFQRMYFIITAVATIGLSLLAGFNGLNIGGVNSNLGLLLWIIGMIGPAVVINTFFDHISLFKRGLIIFPIGMLTLPALAALSPVVDPYLMMSENLGLLAMAFSIIFFAYIGHSFITAVFYLLVNLNKGVGLKITWHLVLIFLIYLVMLILVYLHLTGNTTFGLPVFPVHILLIIVGSLGFLEVDLKTEQIRQPYPLKSIGKSLYLIGFAIALLTFWKAEATVNQPMSDFLQHGFIYTQIAFSTIFFAYLLANFSTLMNSGQMIHKVLFDPKLFAYIHMRLGALIGMLSLIMFADGVMGRQFSTASTNLTAEYYYATERPLEAGILFENAWDRYRRNPKAKNAAAHLSVAQNQPSLAKRELIQGFEVAPTVNDIVMLSSMLHRENNIFDAIFYLSKGLEYFPGNMHLQNNLALLHSKTNKAEQAMQLLDEAGNNQVVVANKIGLQSKHLIRFEEEIEPRGLIAEINALAFHNLKGNIAPFELEYREEVSAPVINRAILANQWSNHVTTDVAEDLSFIDRQLEAELRPSEEEEWRQLRVLRSLQGNQIDEAIKFSNGLAFGFTGSAAYYHHLTALIFAGQMDFPKAAKELRRAEENGYRNWKPEHLAVLYFGGEQPTAFQVATEYDISWPEWMGFEGTELIQNEESKFFEAVGGLTEATKDQLFAQLNGIRDQDLKARLAYEMVWRKAHWMDEKELTHLEQTILAGKHFDQDKAYINELRVFMASSENTSPQQDRLRKMVDQHDLTANSYYTPIVLKAVEQEEEAIEKYTILQEAAIFNRDPLLWINLVKYSRQAGLHQYASEALADMRGWIDDQTLEDLQIKHF